ncbi:MAG: amidohydrolase [Gammaproteobacteria bacterium]|nr:amidohydrolase [Gammaproteobacteria bacterium]
MVMHGFHCWHQVLRQLLPPALLAALALQSGAAVGQPLQPVRIPDVIYHHGRIITMDGQSSVAEAFAVAGERFVAVGSNADVQALAGRRTRQVDLQGATVIPGLFDSHDHLWNSAKFEFRGVDMIGVRSLSEMQARLRSAVARAKAGETVFTTLGWRVTPAPTRQDLDAVSADVPIAVVSSRQGKGVVNSAALKRLGISKASPVFGGMPVPVGADGEPTGAPPGYPASLQMMEALLPPLTPAVEDMMVTKAMARRNALGITSTRELSIWPQAVQALQRMGREGKLTVRMALGVEYPEQLATSRYLARLPPAKRVDPWVFIDCAGEEPWPPGSASLQDFTAYVRAVRKLGWRVAPHVSSDNARGVTFDQATDQTLDAYETLDRDAPLKGQRWYMEHVQFATPQEIERMARLGVIASVQFQGYRPPVPAPLPPERMAHQNPLRRFIDHGVVLIGGSDYTSPTADDPEPNNPFAAFYFYVTRHTVSGASLTPSERISREEALRIFTVNPAYATFQEHEKGRIGAGMLADFVILNQDLMTVPDEKIRATRPWATFVGGRQVYAAPGYPRH